MEVAGLLAVLLSPLVAVLVSMWLQDRKEQRERQLSILGTLVATRHEPTVSAEVVRSLNLIDLVFHDKRSVRGLWHEYYDMLSNEGLNNPNGFEQRNKKNKELIAEMARVLGYGKDVSYLDVDRIYSPVGTWTQFERSEELQAELVRVLRATAKVPVDLREDEAAG
jgi:hypothetical protein